MKKFLKCLYICAAAFLCFSCSNLMNNGSATLVLEFPGASSERFIGSSSTGDIECSSLEMQGDSTFFEIKLKGPITKKYRINYLDENRQPVERLVMDGLVSGRYKMSVLIGNSFFDCTYYGEKDITVYPGANHKNFDVFKLSVYNLKSVNGARIILTYQVTSPDEPFPPVYIADHLMPSSDSTSPDFNDKFIIAGATATYINGYKEILSQSEDWSLKGDVTFSDYSIYRNGTLVATRNDLQNDLVALNSSENGYYIIYHVTGYETDFTLRANIEFQEM
ncbi:hypothetical protein [Treponema sp.]|uniref:hypothetical protein n=1 Tax=Treponema sp. TaxID=166 RepID=UPI00298E9C5F|nr:hypothetical protein [Treponema sp.]